MTYFWKILAVNSWMNWKYNISIEKWKLRTILFWKNRFDDKRRLFGQRTKWSKQSKVRNNWDSNEVINQCLAPWISFNWHLKWNLRSENDRMGEIVWFQIQDRFSRWRNHFHSLSIYWYKTLILFLIFYISLISSCYSFSSIPCFTWVHISFNPELCVACCLCTERWVQKCRLKASLF